MVDQKGAAAPGKPLDILLLLGRPDEPVDGVHDYSMKLASVLTARGHSVSVARLRWDRTGWVRSLIQLRRRLGNEPRAWVLLQFTAGAWSKTLFTSWVLVLCSLVRWTGSHFGVVVHDPFPIPGTRVRDRVRRRYQALVFRILARKADAMFATLDPLIIPWCGKTERETVKVLPVGTNIPVTGGRKERDGYSVGVFCVSRPTEEGLSISHAVRDLAGVARNVRLAIFGRNALLVEQDMRRLLADSSVEVRVDGILPATKVSAILAGLDVVLFVRGGVSSRRGTVAAALAHGLPVVGFRSMETGWPITEAGLVLSDEGDVDGLASSLNRIATEAGFAQELRDRSEAAHSRYFAWERIAEGLEVGLASAERELP